MQRSINIDAGKFVSNIQSSTDAFEVFHFAFISLKLSLKYFPSRILKVYLSACMNDTPCNAHDDVKHDIEKVSTCLAYCKDISKI